MRKIFGAALAAALVGGLAAAALSVGASDRASSGAHYGTGTGDDTARALARRATKTWKGELKDSGPDTLVEITAKFRRGKATAIKELNYEGLPADCEVSGERTLAANPVFTGLRVNKKRKFRIVDESSDGDASIKFTGKFSRSFNKVAGKLQNTIHFPSGPEETCVSETKPYVAKR